MRSSWFGQVVVALVLVAGGAILWRAAEFEQRIAAAERDLVTLRYDSAAAEAAAAPSRLAALMPGGGRTVADARSLQATAAYWEADYDTVAANPEAKLLSANASYRAIRREGGTWQVVVGRLDQLVKSYADILRNDADNTEAAFNYEYAVRLRSVIAARKRAVAPVGANDSTTVTIHGFAGAPPEESDMKKFKMIVPMRPDERLEAEKAGKGTTKVKKG